MKIIQINVTSIRNKKPQLSQFLGENKIDVAIISETFLKPEHKFGIPNYNIIRSDRDTTTFGGGVAILLEKSILVKVLKINATNKNIEIAACEFNSHMGQIVILSTYIPPTPTYDSKDLENILKQIPSNAKVLWCGDFNAHNQLWGNSSTDNKGTHVMNFIEDNNLVLLNDGSKTFFGCANPTAIDLSICSPALGLISSWSTLNESLGSSHCMIYINVQLKPSLQQKISYGVPKNIPTNILNDKVKAFMDSQQFSNCPEEKKFCEFSTFFYDTFKTRISRKNYPDSPWWNTNCKKVKAGQIKALSQMKKNPSRENLKKFIEKKKIYLYTIRKEKREGWKATCESINSETTPTELWSVIKKFRE